MLKIRVFGTASQLRTADLSLRAELDKWNDYWPKSPFDLRLIKAPPKLAGHVLVIGHYDEGGQISFGGAGCSMSAQQSATSFVGELIERQFGLYWVPPDTRRATKQELQREGQLIFPVEDYIGVPRFPEKWPYGSFNQDEQRTWVQGSSLPSNRPIWIPASFITRNLPARGEGLVELNTVGMAAGPTTEVSVRHAVLEILERDAVMDAWLGGYGFCSLEGNGISGYEEFQHWDRSSGWRTRLLSVTGHFGVQVVVALCLSEHGNAYSLGCSADELPHERVAHALAEAVQVRMISDLKPMQRTDVIRGFMDRLFYYSESDRLEQLHRLHSARDAGPLIKNDYGRIISTLRNRGSVVAAVDMRPADNRTPTWGSVTRVLATEVQPMEADEDHARLAVRLAHLRREPYSPHPFG